MHIKLPADSSCACVYFRAKIIKLRPFVRGGDRTRNLAVETS